MNLESSRALPHSLRAWFFLIWLSIKQQARVRLMLLVSLGLLALVALIVFLTTYLNAWEMRRWRMRRGRATVQQYLDTIEYNRLALALDIPGSAARDAVIAAVDETLHQTAFHVFSNGIIFALFATFLLPLFSLSFGTEALGREREAGNLIWLLSRPLSRPAIYLAKFVSLLPWSLGLNLGGFALLCVLAGEPGYLALRLYWPAIFWGTVAFCALFHLMAALFQRAAIIAILYSFFLETIMGNLPGYLKRASISFYVRCMMFDAGAAYHIGPARPEQYLPVSGWVAWVVLAAVTVGLLSVGMFVFSRREYLQ